MAAKKKNSGFVFALFSFHFFKFYFGGYITMKRLFYLNLFFSIWSAWQLEIQVGYVLYRKDWSYYTIWYLHMFWGQVENSLSKHDVLTEFQWQGYVIKGEKAC